MATAAEKVRHNRNRAAFCANEVQRLIEFFELNGGPAPVVAKLEVALETLRAVESLLAAFVPPPAVPVSKRKRRQS